MKNIVAKLTLRQLKLNFRRTIITIIGIALSVTMLTATSSVVTSFIDGMKRDEIAKAGEWHTRLNDMPMKNTDKITEKIPNVSDVLFLEWEGFAPIPQKGDKKFFYIEGYSKSTFNHFNVTISQGRLPQKDGELIISEEAAKAGYKIGQSFTLELGYRGVKSKPVDDEHRIDGGTGDEVFSGEGDEKIRHLRFDDIYVNEDKYTYEEEFYPEDSKTYTIVGVFSDRARYYTSENPYSPAFEAISFLDPATIKADDTVSPLLLFNKLNTDIYKNTEKGADALGAQDYSRHSSLLQFYGLSSREGVTIALFAFVSVLVIIILIGSVAFIYNAFAISLADRSKYLGLLACVGATKKQKRYSVILEGVILGAIAIPLGLLAGFGGIAVTLKLLNPYIQQFIGSNTEFYLVVLPATVIVSILLGIFTIFLSLIRPMKNAAKTSPIEAVRRTNDISVKKKQIKTSRLTKKLFGFEGMLAMKNIKRNPGRYRITVASLSISIVLFLTTVCAVGLAKDAYTNEIGYTEESYNVFIQANVNTPHGVCQQDGKEEKAFNEIFNELSKNSDTEWITFKDSLFCGDRGMVPSDNISDTEIAEKTKALIATPDGKEELMHINVIMSETSYRDKNKKNVMDNVKSDEAVLVNYSTTTEYDDSDKEVVYKGEILKKTPDKIDFFFTDSVEYASEKMKASPDKVILKSTYVNPDTNKTVDDKYYGVPFYSVKIGAETKEPISSFYDCQFSVAVHPELFREIGLAAEKADLTSVSYYPEIYLKTDNAQAAIAIANEIAEKNEVRIYYNNLEEELEEKENIVTLISVFSGGFIALMILICIANIFNTVSTGIMLRRREFAMLKSTGMTPKAFRGMIKYESLFYAFKALLYGVPISMVITLILVLVFQDAFETTFFTAYPWLALIIAAVSILVLVGSTAFYALRRIDKESIMDVLKDENT